MFFQAISTFQFNVENVQSHALNIKKLSEWITIEECHLGLSHCRELTAIAFGFKTAEDLKEALKESDFSTLSLSATIESDLSTAIHKFSKTIPFMLIKDEDVKHFDLEWMVSAFCDKEEKKDSPLVECQKFWKDWHVMFAKFLTKYFKETHGRFEWFNSLELIDLNCACKNSLVLRYGDHHEFTFLNLAIYNHLVTQYAGDYKHYKIVAYDKDVLYDKNIEDRIYIVSESLQTYIKDNWESIVYLKENTYDLNQERVLEYDVESKQAKLNLIFCKKWLVNNLRCPTQYRGFNYGVEEGTYKSFLFEKWSYEKPFSFMLPYRDDSNFMNQLRLKQGVVLTEDDFFCAGVSDSFAIQKLLEHDGHSFVTNGQFSDEVFDLKWDKTDFFDVTPHSFKLNETFTADYVFRKALANASLHEVNGNLELLQPFLEVRIKSRVYGTLNVSVKDSKITIELSDIKTKLSRFGQTIPVQVEFYTKNTRTGKVYTYSDESMSLMIGALTNRQSFKKMLDAHLYIGPYKQFILKHHIADVYRSHQHTTLLALAEEKAETV